VALRVVAALGDHVLPAMLDAGLLATVNSDDPAYFTAARKCAPARRRVSRRNVGALR
jgi:adenosine deaminase